MSDFLNNEQELMERVGNQNPFRVPDGYFEAFPSAIMSQIKQREQRRRRIWHWAAAAVVAGCVAGAGLSMMQWAPGTAHELASGAANTEYVNEMLDCNMMSNLDIENYLSEAE